MRLRPELREKLKAMVSAELGPDAEVWLFGSRVDDRLRGGDIDLLVRSPRVLDERATLESRLAVRAMRLADGRRVDLLLMDAHTPPHAVHAEALATGVPL